MRSLERLSLPDYFDHGLPLLPIGNIPDPFLAAIESRLTQELRISVEIREAISPPRSIAIRNKLVHKTEKIIASFEEDYSGDTLEDFYKEFDFMEGKPQTADDKLFLLPYLTLQEDHGEEAWDKAMPQKRSKGMSKIFKRLVLPSAKNGALPPRI